MNTPAFALMLAFAILTLLTRIALSWLKRLSYVSADQTPSSVAEHREQVKSGQIVPERELRWLVRVSPRPRITGVLYCAFYFLASLGPLGFLLAVIDLFVPALDRVLNVAVFCLIVLCVLSQICYHLLNDPIVYSMTKNKKE